MAKTKIIELFLTADASKREQCLDTIRDTFKVQRPWQYYINPVPELANFFRFESKADKNIWDLAAELLKIEGVIEADPVLQLIGVDQRGAYDSDDDYPDASVSTLWNHHATNFIKARQLVDRSEPVIVKIGQLDTGYTFHPGIYNKIEMGWDLLDKDDDPFDPLADGVLKQPGHGTSTSSVVIGGGFQPNPASIQQGVWPDVQFQVYRVAKSVVHIFHSYLGEAICRAVDDGCNVITISMGGAPPRRSWLEALRYAYDKGVIVCSAAGNNVGFVVWPARYTNAVAVAGTNVNDQRWEGSSRGEDVDVSAPGENVYVAQTKRAEDDAIVFLNSFGSGTSYATPHIAAAAAMWLHQHRSQLASIQGRERVDAFREALSASVRVPQGWDTAKMGAGILDAESLIKTPPKITSAPKGLKAAKGGKPTAFKLHSSGKKTYSAKEAVADIRSKELMYLYYNTIADSAEDQMKKMLKNASVTARKTLTEIDATAKKAPKPAKGLKGAKGLKKVKAVTIENTYQNFLDNEFLKIVNAVS